MPNHPPRAQAAPSDHVLEWLLDGDPSIRWQVLRDLTDAPAHEVAAERGRVASEGWGARLLEAQASDGRWGEATWNRGWTSTMHVLTLLWQFGLDPRAVATRRALQRVREHVTWRGVGPPECDDHRYFEGELEPCINAQVAAAGAGLGHDVDGIIGRLLDEQLPDGGWNCEAPQSSSRSSFNTTICVLEALLAVAQAGGSSPRSEAARARGEAYLLDRHLCRRRSTGERIEHDRKGGTDWTRFAFPTWWHYDLLRALDYFRSAGATADERVEEAVGIVASKRDTDGRWRLDVRYAGTMPGDLGDRVGETSRWITLRALRVLRWSSAGT